MRPAYETLYLNDQAGQSTAFTHYVDAESGAILVRKDIVEQSHPAAATFSGAVPPTDGACDDQGSWTVSPGESVGSVAVVVQAHVPANDVVLHLLRNGTIVASADTATSPEARALRPARLGRGHVQRPHV